MAVFNSRAALAVVFSTLLLGLKAATSALTIPLMLSRFGSSQTALWLLLQTTWNYALFAELGLGQVLMNRVGEARARNDWSRVSRVASTGIAITCILSGFLALLCWAAVRLTNPAALMLGSRSPDVSALNHLLAIVLPAAMLRIAGSTFAGLLSGLDDHHVRTGLDAAQPAVVLIAVVAAIFLSRSLETIVTVFAVTSVAASLFPAVFLGLRHSRCSLRPSNLSSAEARGIGGMIRGYVALPFILSMHRSLPVFVAARVLPLKDLPGIYLLSMYARLFFVNLLDSFSKSIQPGIITLHAGRDTASLRRGWRQMSSAIGLGSAALLPLMVTVYMSWVEPAGRIDPRTPFAAVSAFAGMFWLDSIVSVGTNYLLAIGEFRRLTIAWAFGLLAKIAILGAAIHGSFVSTPTSLGLLLFACDACLWFPANLAAFSAALASPFGRTFRAVLLPWLCLAAISIAACRLVQNVSVYRPVVTAAALCLSLLGLAAGQRFLPASLRLWIRNRLRFNQRQILFN